ncbi:hypothetical protein [Micromonospora sonneratiae]|uniref:Uncharacterized protein n=1 Tax=Micromonospora sonneratiae TaxID=1184706 RepID=A0ABW3YPF4_9ACTN
MGSLVRYVVVQNGVVSRYAMGGGAAMGVDYNFAIGPAAVLRWLSALDDDYDGDDGWAHDWACRDALLIDADRRRLLFYTGLSPFDCGETYAYRAALLDGYSRTWPGWAIEWAYEGTGDLVAALGEDRSVVREADPFITELFPHGRGEPGGPVGYVVSVADETGCRAYALDAFSEQPWRLGPDLLTVLPAEEPVTACRTMPLAGLHLDTRARRAGLWSIEALRGLSEWWPQRWPGWELEFRADDPSHQLARAENLTFPPVDLDLALRKLAYRVERYWPVEESLRKRGIDVDEWYEWYPSIRANLDARVTPAEVNAAVAAILDGRQPYEF